VRSPFAFVWLGLPVAGTVAFLLLAVAVVRGCRPAQPRRWFLALAVALVAAVGWLFVALRPVRDVDDAVAFTACVLLQALLSFTVWNAFYSILWGFSGGLCHDLLADQRLRHVDRLVDAYEGHGGINRILARRIPNLVAGGSVGWEGSRIRLRSKGRAVATGTTAAYRLFSLGSGGGVNPRW
jgi:hypothetical protein